MRCVPSGSFLSSEHQNPSTLFSFKHYLVIHSNVILDQMDLLEENILCNVIILNTVLDEVKHKNLPTYKRLISVIKNPMRHFFVFVNDHHKEIYLKQNDVESGNDYQDRCIRAATNWYANHMFAEQFIVVIMQEDK